jgi:hypothetical protein
MRISSARLAIALAGASLGAWSLAADPRWAERHVLAPCCATTHAGWIAARALPWVAGALGVAAVLASARLAPSWVRWAARTRARLRAASLAGVALAVAASLLVAELAMRRLHDALALGERPWRGGAGAPMARSDPVLGWSYVPGRTTWVRVGGRVVAYAIDAHGDRARSADDLPDPARPALLFTGESIAFGYGLAYDETFPFLVGRDLGVQSVNLAVVGYGSDQAHRRLAEALRRFERPVAAVTLFVPDQLRRNVDAWRPRLALGPEGALRDASPASGLRLTKLLQQLPYHDDEALRVTAAVLRASADNARARGAVPLFVVTNYGAPCLRERGGEAWVVDELFTRQGLPFVRVDLEEEDRLPGAFERHPSARGARKIAAAVERALAPALAAQLAPPDRRPRRRRATSPASPSSGRRRRGAARASS